MNRTEAIKFIKNHHDEIAEYALDHTKQNTAKRYLISVGGVDSALFQAGFSEKCSKWYRDMRAKVHQAPRKSRVVVDDMSRLSTWEDILKSGKVEEYIVSSLMFMFKQLEIQKNETTKLTQENHKLKEELTTLSIILNKCKKTNENLLLQAAQNALVTFGD